MGKWSCPSKIRKAVFEKWGSGCYACGLVHEEGQLEIHHVVSRADGGSDDVSNLRPLCGICHRFVPDHDAFDEYVSHNGFNGCFALGYLIYNATKHGLSISGVEHDNVKEVAKLFFKGLKEA